MQELKNRLDKVQSVPEDLTALYKQATLGDCSTGKPSMFSFSAKREWECWTSKRGMTQSEACLEFIKQATIQLR